MEAELPTAIVQSAAEQVVFDEAHLISFGRTNENCVRDTGHILP